MPNPLQLRIQHKRSLAATWAYQNPILAPGEIGVEVDTNKFKIGDGTTRWNFLPSFGTLNEVLDMVENHMAEFPSGAKGDQGETGPQGDPGPEGPPGVGSIGGFAIQDSEEEIDFEIEEGPSDFSSPILVTDREDPEENGVYDLSVDAGWVKRESQPVAFFAMQVIDSSFEPVHSGYSAWFADQQEVGWGLVGWWVTSLSMLNTGWIYDDDEHTITSESGNTIHLQSDMFLDGNRIRMSDGYSNYILREEDSTSIAGKENVQFFVGDADADPSEDVLVARVVSDGIEIDLSGEGEDWQKVVVNSDERLYTTYPVFIDTPGTTIISSSALDDLIFNRVVDDEVVISLSTPQSSDLGFTKTIVNTELEVGGSLTIQDIGQTPTDIDVPSNTTVILTALCDDPDDEESSYWWKVIGSYSSTLPE